MKTIQWKIFLTENNKIASVENATGLPQDEVESHLLIIGLLENLKQRHLNQLNTLFQRTFKGKNGEENGIDL